MKSNQSVLKNYPTKSLHPWLWTLIVGSAVLAIVLLAISGYAIRIAPTPISPTDNLWSSLKDIGPAIAGFWVVAAAIFTITAAGVTTLADAKREDKNVSLRNAAVRNACISEILAFWDRLNSPEPIRIKLEDHVGWLNENLKDPNKNFPDIFRRNLGEDWFMLSRLDPLAISELGDLGAEYISLSARARNVVGRLNWMNSAPLSSQQPSFWVSYHRDTVVVLKDVLKRSHEMLQRLDRKDIDLMTFSFAAGQTDSHSPGRTNQTPQSTSSLGPKSLMDKIKAAWKLERYVFVPVCFVYLAISIVSLAAIRWQPTVAVPIYMALLIPCILGVVSFVLATAALTSDGSERNKAGVKLSAEALACFAIVAAIAGITANAHYLDVVLQNSGIPQGGKGLKDGITLLIAIVALPFAVAATGRKLAVAMFEWKKHRPKSW